MGKDSLEDLTNFNLDEYLKENVQPNLFDLLNESDFSKEFDYKDGNYRLRVKFMNLSSNQDPEYASDGSSGFDLRANIDDSEYNGSVVVPSGKVMIIPTGLYYEVPEGFEIQIRPRSGLAAKFGVTVLNTPGTIDSDYRGEIMIIIYNTGSFGDFTINHGDRIAQGVITSVYCKKTVSFEKTNSLSNTDRGSGGFGHTGRK